MHEAVIERSHPAVGGAPTLLCNVICQLAESPVWDERRDCLFWCDIPAGRLHAFSPASGAAWRMEVPSPVGSLGLCRSGRLVVACGWDILLVDPEAETIETLAAVPRPAFPGRLNDGRVGPDGAFWVGAMHAVPFARMEPLASLYRVTPDGAVRPVLGGLKVSNGLAFAPDGTRLYHSDSVQKWVDVHRFDPMTGAVGPGRRLCEPDDGQGRPDGAATDSTGTYWSAGVSAGVLNGYDDSGRLIRRIPLAVPHPTMPCFGGADFSTLYVASHREGMTEEGIAAAPWSGGILTGRAERPGLPSPRFKD